MSGSGKEIQCEGGDRMRGPVVSGKNIMPVGRTRQSGSYISSRRTPETALWFFIVNDKLDGKKMLAQAERIQFHMRDWVILLILYITFPVERTRIKTNARIYQL